MVQNCLTLFFMNDEMRSHLGAITGGASARAIAASAGLTASTLIRQLSGEMKIQTLIAICRAYDKPLVPCLIAAGYMTEAEARNEGTQSSIRDATDQELVDEIMRRVVEGSATSALFNPVGPRATTRNERHHAMG